VQHGRTAQGFVVNPVPSRPPVVERALELARQLGCEPACSDEEGRLLHVLAAARGRQRVAELGAGCGVATAWLAAALRPGVPLFAAEADEELAVALERLFIEDVDVHVLAGDWRETLPEQAPFDLLRCGEPADVDAVVGLLAPGGLVVAPPPLAHKRLETAELRVSADESVSLGVLAL
jgi:predicted O-methyltransferase YrrM